MKKESLTENIYSISNRNKYIRNFIDRLNSN